MVPTTRPLVRTEDRSSGLSRSGRRRRRQLGEAEVQHLDESVRPAYHVLGLEIAVHDTCGVRSAQGSSDLHGEIERLAPPDGPSCQALSQRFALHELHRDKLLAVGCFAECVNRADVRMVQSGDGARLLLEAGDAGRVLRQIGRKNLERDLPLELEITGEPDLAHAAASEKSDNLERVQPRPGTDRHTTARV
jgi:hypothetical protein